MIQPPETEEGAETVAAGEVGGAVATHDEREEVFLGKVVVHTAEEGYNLLVGDGVTAPDVYHFRVDGAVAVADVGGFPCAELGVFAPGSDACAPALLFHRGAYEGVDVVVSEVVVVREGVLPRPEGAVGRLLLHAVVVGIVIARELVGGSVGAVAAVVVVITVDTAEQPVAVGTHFEPEVGLYAESAVV